MTWTNREGDYEDQESGKVITGHFHESENYSTQRPHGMRDWLITFTLDGEGVFQTPAGEKVCRSGDVTLLKAGVPHLYGTQKGMRWHFIWAHFPAEGMEFNLLPEEEVSIFTIDRESARKRIYRAFKRVLSDSQERGEYWHALCMSALREVLLLLARKNHQPKDARIEEILQLLSRNMREPVQVEALGQKVGLSASRLSHLFKENTGMSIIEALNDMRIRQAALLLEHTNRNSSEVADDVGYHNYNHFINQFRKRFGMSPSAYAKSLRQARNKAQTE
jgi:AraC family transcriptional regulator of arabinose operon